MFLVNVPGVDYLRLTSFEGKIIGGFHKLVLNRSNVDLDANWRQYKGISSGQIFAGVAKQRNKIHGLLDVPGIDAYSVMSFEAPRGPDVKCTRIDLQVSIPLIKKYRYRARNFKDALENSDWKNTSGTRIHKRYIKLIEGPSEFGLDTVYIGSRSSERLARVYVKEDPNKETYLRFETEFKGAIAQAVHADCVNDGRKTASILRGEWERIPSVKIAAWEKIGSVLAEFSEGDHVSIPRSAGDNDSRYVWFANSVVPALGKLLNDHDCGHLVRRTLEELLVDEF